MKKLAFSVFAAALTFGANAEDSVEVSAAAATETGSAFDGIYFGLGVAAVDNGVKCEGSQSGSDHSTRIAATTSLGYGRVVSEKAFLGLEAGLDASQNFEYGSAKVNGLTPSAALRIGFVNPANRSMIYLKGGAAYSKGKLYSPEIRCNKWSPIVALGAEKICGKLRTRLEAEYRFRANKTVDTVKLINRGAVTVRAMAVYTVKM